jgi:hypothetical protein
VSRRRPTAEELPGSDPNDLPTGYSLMLIRLDRGSDGIALTEALIDYPLQGKRTLLRKRR